MAVLLRRLRRSFFAAAGCGRAGTLAALLVASGGARAEPAPLDPESLARAEALFQTGTDLLEAGDVAAACPKLEAAVEITRGQALGGKLVLARCYEAAGRTASAFGLYREVDARARAAGQVERADNAAEHARSLADRVHYLHITVHVALDDARVVLDGEPLPRAAWATPIPVDPGPREITLGAPGYAPTRRRVAIPALGGTTEVVFDVPLEKVTARPSIAEGARSAQGAEGSFWSPQRAAGLATWVVGGAGTTVGLVLGGVAISEYQRGLETGRCSGSPPTCTDPGPLRDARTLGDVSTAFFFAGIGVSALGVILFTTAPNEAQPVTVGVTPSGVYLGVEL